jgi:4-hydroxybenzoate polyprenyltransferase
MNRWWTYQRERFPLLAHGLLIAAFSSSAVCFSAQLRGAGGGLPPAPVFAVAFVSCFLFFLQLRVADEFKDFEEDSRYRPYRPVPRGLVGLRELGGVFAVAAVVQLAAALVLEPLLALILVVAWSYLALMGVEFFARDWLVARPVTYLWTHMLIMPIVDFYATACDWLPAAGRPPAGLAWFLAASFANGVVIEVGRKVRPAVDEEEGVRTYSALWGPRRAAWAWASAVATTLVCAVLAARAIGFVPPLLAVLGLAALGAVALAATFRGTAPAGAGTRFETFSGAWTIALYLMLGLVPVLTRAAFAR